MSWTVNKILQDVLYGGLTHLVDVASVHTSFTGPAPQKEAQYDIEISWPPSQFFGGINITVSCNATDENGRPLAAVQPLPFAVVANPQLK